MTAPASVAASLHWVQAELAQSLVKVRGLLEKHMDAPADALPLQQAIAELHQVRGTAAMLQCGGLAALADEMKAAVQDLLQGQVSERDAAYAALLGASVQLGDYIDALDGGVEDSVLVFQPAISELRLARGKPVPTESELFAEQLAAAAPSLAPPPEAQRVPGAAQAAAAKFQLVFQQNLLLWLKGQDVQLALGRLGKVAEQVAAGATTEPVHRLWRVLAAAAEALLTKGLDESTELKRLFGRAGAQLKLLAEGGEAVAAPASGALPYQLLFYVGRSRSQGPRVSALRTAYGLQRVLPGAEALDALRQRIRGPNTALLAKLSEEIRKDLAQVKDHIDLVVRAGDKAPHDLAQTVDQLGRIGVTLNMLGLAPLQAMIQVQARALGELASGATVPTDAVWLDIATALLRVEHSLDDALYRQLRHVRRAERDDGLPEVDMREGRGALLRELLVDLARVKAVVDGYFKLGDAAVLTEAGRLLGHLHTGLTVLGDDRVTAPVGQLRDYVLSPAFAHTRSEKAQAEAFADAVAGLEYYFESLADRDQDSAPYADAVIRAVARLEVADGAPAAPPRPAAAAVPARAAAPVAADDVDPEIRAIFLDEAAEVLSLLQAALPKLRRDSAARETWTEVRRAFHTLKGSGRMVGARDIGEFAWAVENLLNRGLEGTRPLSGPVLALVEEATAALPALVEAFRDAQPVPAGAVELQNHAHRLAKGDESGPDPELLQVFCEDARERVAAIEAWVRAQDDSRPDFAVGREVMNALHTLRGAAASVNAQGIGGLAGQLESYLGALRAGGLRLLPPGFALLRDAIPHLREWIDRLAQGSAAEPDLKPWLRRLADAQAAVPASARDAVARGEAIEHFAHEGFTRLEQAEKLAAAWRARREDSADARALQAVLETLRGDAGTAQCGPMQAVATALTRRLGELIGERAVPSDAFFADLAAVIEGMYCQLDDFREGKLEGDGAALVASAAAVGAVRSDAAAEEPATGEILEVPPVAEDEPALELPQAGEAAEEVLEIPPVEVDAADIDPELRAIFIGEADELLEELDRQFAQLERDRGNASPVAEAARALHTLKGGARMAGLDGLGDASHHLESLLEAVVAGAVPRDAALHARLHNVMDRLYGMVDAARRGENPDAGPVLRELGEDAPAAPAAAPPPPQPSALVREVAARLDPVPAALDPELLRVFSAEADELLQGLQAALTAWQSDASDDEALREMQRRLHTLKGGARTAGVLAMGAAAHALESQLESLAGTSGPLPAAALAELHSQLETLQRMHDRLARGDAAGLVEAVPAADGPGPAPEVIRFAEPAAAPASTGPWDPALFWHPEGGAEGLAGRQRETARVAVEQLDRMLNSAGEISIYRARVEQHNNALQFQLNEMQNTLARVREHLRALDIETETQIAARGFSQGLEMDRDKRADFDPLEMDRFSRMQELSRSLSESIGDLAALRATMDDQLSEAETLLMQQGRVSTEIQQGLMATLMVPFSRQVQRLQRVVKQTAQETGKQAEVRFDGIEQELDRNVLERMVAPLEHLLRNSVVHGIESPERRRAAGKPDSGAIQVTLRREGTQLAIEVRDDGKGLDYAAIRRTAIERGLMAEGAPLRDQEVAMFIFEAGFSTASVVTQAAGRGVGMDVVAAEVKQLGGTLELSSEPGRGARFLIRLPLTLALSQALLVGVGAETYAIPLPTIESIARVPRDKLGDYLRDDGPAFVHAGQEYRMRSLAALLELPGHALPDEKTLPVVLVRLGEGLTAADRRVAVVVDTLLGNREIVSKPVGPQVSAVQGISGGTILPDGRVVLILDVPALVTNRARRVAVAEAARVEAVAAPLADERTAIMVVDDSITIRRVTERLLERAGYRVLLAVDGLDAMTQLQTERPAVILLDIEMPRADGFEVAAFIRNNDAIRATPIIMITSRSGEKHRERARQLGVNQYLIKPYQEEQLLAEIRTQLEAAA